MGTSNLYKGPKGTSLLPADYTEELEESVSAPLETSPVDEEQPEENNSEDENDSEDEKNLEMEVPLVSWTLAKRTFSQQIGKSTPNVRLIAKNYTKALGGYKHAAKTVTSSKKITRGIITLFSGSPDAIRRKFETIGIVFESRSTQEIFNDIYNYLCSGSATREEAISDRALSQTFSELFESDLLNDNSLDIFTPDLLEFLVSHFVTNSIFNKLLNEDSFGELTGDKSNEDIAKLENELKTFIDGLVKGRVSEHLHDGVTRDEVNKFVNELYEDCYKVMEGLA